MASHAVAAAAAVGRGADVFGSLASCQAQLVVPEMNIGLAQEALTCPGETSSAIIGHITMNKITQI